jgi:hypothetical protein
MRKDISVKRFDPPLREPFPGLTNAARAERGFPESNSYKNTRNLSGRFLPRFASRGEIYNKLYQLNMEYELLMCYTLRWLMMGIMRPFGSERVS